MKSKKPNGNGPDENHRCRRPDEGDRVRFQRHDGSEEPAALRFRLGSLLRADRLGRCDFQLLRDFRERLGTARRVLGQTRSHDPFPSLIDRLALDLELFATHRHRRRDLFANLPVDVARGKGRLAREKFVSGRAEGVNVVEVTAALAVKLLRTHENQGATPALLHCEHADRIAQTARYAEIGNLEVAALIDH